MMMVSIVACLCIHAQGQWTLEQCINYALQNNITLRQAQLSKQSATEERKQAKAALLPSLSASTNQSVGHRPWAGSNINKSYYNGTYSITGQWTVWNGGQNTNLARQSKLAEEQAELEMQETANSIQERIAQLYVQILYMNDALIVNRQSLEASLKNEERGRTMVEIGQMSKADLAQLTAQRATDEYNIVEAEADLADCKLELKQLLELTGEEAFDVVIPPTTAEQALADIPSLLSVYEQALLTRPEIKGTEVALKSSELQQKIAKAGYLPTVSLTAGVGTNTSSNASNGWGDQMKTNFDATGGISIPIFDQRKAKTAVSKARIQHEKALLDQQDQRKQLYQAIEGYWLDAQSNQQKFRAALLSVESEQLSYDLLSEQFQLGLKNIVELLNGKTSLLKAQQNMLQAKYLTILSVQLLRFYQGETMNI